MLFPGNHPIICKEAIYAPDAPRSLISYRDLRANEIHVYTLIENDEETLVLSKGQRSFATALVGANGLYEIVIKAISPGPRPEEEVGLAIRERGPSTKAPNLARKTSLYLTATTLSYI